MEEKKPAETTTVQEVEVSEDTLNEILGMPGAESVMVPTSDTKKPSVFSKEAVDMTFLEKSDNQEEKSTSSENQTATKTETAAAIQQATEQLNEILEEEAEASDSKSGRPRVDKSGLVETFTKLIDKGLIFPFNEDKPLDKYTTQDFKNYLKQILQRKKKLSVRKLL